MSPYQQVRSYLEAVAFELVPMPEQSPDGVGDDRGLTMEHVVIVGASALGAAAIAVILWATLRDGASDVTVPAPAAA